MSRRVKRSPKTDVRSPLDGPLPEDPISRRAMMRVTAGGAMGLGLTELLATQAQGTVGESLRRGFGRAKSCIVLFAWGGMSHLDTWDMKPEADDKIRGLFKPIKTATPGIFLSEHLPRLAKQTERMAIVRSVHHRSADHRMAAYWNLTGHEPEGLGAGGVVPPILPSRKDWPCIGSMVAKAIGPRQVQLAKAKYREESVSLSTQVLGPGRFSVGTLSQQDGYTNNDTVELIGMIAAGSKAATPLTRSKDGPVGDFTGMIAGDSTAGDWGSDTHGRGGNLFLPGDGDADSPHTGFGAHANKFITFDLHAIRAKFFAGSKDALHLTGRIGVNGSPGVPGNAAVMGGVWLDGKQLVVSGEISHDHTSYAIDIALAAGEGRYLTLAMLNGPKSTYYDDVAMCDMQISRRIRIDSDEPDTTSTALPGTITLPYPIADRGLENGQYGGFLGAKYDPVFMQPGSGKRYAGVSPNSGVLQLSPQRGLNHQRMGNRRSLLQELDGKAAEWASRTDLVQYRQQAMDMLLSPSVRAAFDVNNEPRTTRNAYGNHICGQSQLMARRLTEAGVPLVTVYCSVGDLNGAQGSHFDTHSDNFNRLKRDLLPPLDQASAALLDDLDARGTLDETLVVWMTEFGRTPQVDAGAGRNHFPHCYSVAFAGGGVQGGQIYGKSDRIGARPIDAPCTPADLHATIFHALGIDPHIRIKNLDGIPLLMSEGKPLPLF